MLSYAIDQIPLWVWIILALGASGVLFYFFAPVLIPLWSVTPKPIKVILGATIALVGAVLWGRHRGASDEREMQRKREAEAINARREINEDVKNASDADLDQRAGRWMRDEELRGMGEDKPVTQRRSDPSN